MKKITLLLIGLLASFTSLQAQNFDYIYTNGGADTNQNSTKTVTDWLHYDNGSNYTSFGSNNGTPTIGAYIKLTSSLLGGHINRQIEELKFYLGDDATNISGNVSVEIYTDPNSAAVYTEDFPMSGLTAGDWNTVTLSTPYIIDGSELYVGYVYSAPGYIAGADDGTTFVAGVNYYTYNGGAMTPLDNLATVNFNIQAGIGGPIPANDAGLTNAYLDEILQPGTVQIEGIIHNYGTNTLTSIDFNYSVDGGTVNTDNISGLNLARGESATVTHSVPWNATAGTHTVDVSISNFNGNGPDEISANDHCTTTVSVASGSTQKLPLFEEFTSSTCAPCANFNSNDFNQAFLTSNAGNFSLIKYQMNWPSPGDPYYTNEGGDRRAYYGVNGVPTLFLDGSKGPDFFQNPGQLQPELDAANASPAFFEITASHEIDNANNINVTVDITPYVSGNFTLHCAVVEKTTTGNVGNNGETEFYNVMMKMVPDASGTSVNLTNDVQASYNLSASLNNTNIEEMTDLEVIVFIQNDNNKSVMQSAISTDTNAIEDEYFDKLVLYPLPANDQIYIDNATGMKLEIYDTKGTLLITREQLTNSAVISLEKLSNGIYFAKFTDNDKIGIKRIIINK